MDRITVDPGQRVSTIDRNIFGGFVEHLGRCVYGGIFEPGSRLSGPDGLRTDVLEASRRLRYSNIRYPGGNFVSAYRWRDGVGPVGGFAHQEEATVGVDGVAQHVARERFVFGEEYGLCGHGVVGTVTQAAKPAPGWESMRSAARPA